MPTCSWGPFDFTANSDTPAPYYQDPDIGMIVLPLDVAYLKAIPRQMAGEQAVVEQAA
jgi:hypothetical protein